jgi:hypothetical protein
MSRLVRLSCGIRQALSRACCSPSLHVCLAGCLSVGAVLGGCWLTSKRISFVPRCENQLIAPDQTEGGQGGRRRPDASAPWSARGR